MTGTGRRWRRFGFVTASVSMTLAACGSTASSGGAGIAGPAGPTTTVKSSVTTEVRCPSSPKPVSFSQPSPWQTIGRTGPEGMYRDKDVTESTMTITNPNSVPVKARAIVLLSDPTMDPPAARLGKLVEYGIPRKAGLRSDGGIDYSVAVSPGVPAGATVQVAARRLATPPPTVKALYGYAVIEPPPAVFGSCDFPVTGADPFKLLPGYTQTYGCIDPAAGC